MHNVPDFQVLAIREVERLSTKGRICRELFSHKQVSIYRILYIQKIPLESAVGPESRSFTSQDTPHNSWNQTTKVKIITTKVIPAAGDGNRTFENLSITLGGLILRSLSDLIGMQWLEREIFAIWGRLAAVDLVGRTNNRYAVWAILS